MASGIKDLGGVTLTLGGGSYLISEPIVVPPYIGNLHFSDGTLIASAMFDPTKHLFHVGNSSCVPTINDKPDQQKSCNEFISFTDMMFDSAFNAVGGAVVQHVMGTTFTACFWTGFTGNGLQIDGGHEVMVYESWFAECYWSESSKCVNRDDESIAVQINGNDHYLHNVIIFDYVKKGVEINGAANVLSGVHTWNGGGIGIEINAGNNRLEGCYLDYNYLLIQKTGADNGADKLVVANTFFYHTNTRIKTGGEMKNVLFHGNIYAGLGDLEAFQILDDSDYSTRTNVRFESEIGEVYRSTKSTKSEVFQNSTGVLLDFTDDLIFDNIEHVHFSAVSLGDEAENLIPKAKQNGKKVIVEVGSLTQPVKVSVTVEQ